MPIMLISRSRGFTLIELLIVISVIAILALITIVAYNGLQQRAQYNKVAADLTQLEKVIMIARINAGDKTLAELTGKYYTSGPCASIPLNVEPIKANRTTNTQVDQCWTNYLYFLDQISQYSGTNVRDLTDPWGWPYWLDENEGDSSYCGTARDTLSAMKHPRTSADWAGTYDPTKRIAIPNVRPGCSGT